DRFKRENTELGRNARQAIREIDRLRQHGSLSDGVVMDHGGKLKVVLHHSSESKLRDFGLKPDSPDNQIISAALYDQSNGHRVIFASKDINCRVKADALGLKVMDFEKEKVDFDTLYNGWREVHVSGEIVNTFWSEKKVSIADVATDACPNEFFILRDE